MENFDELCRLYGDWRQRNLDYGRQATQFMLRFAAELAKQIGAPDSFKQRNIKVPYVRALRFDPQENAFDALRPIDVLHWDDDDGAWDAGVGIVIEKGKNTFPKSEFTIKLRFKLQDKSCELQITPEGEFRVDIDDAASWRPAIEYIVGALKTTFNLKPWEPWKQRQRIGFTWSDDKDKK